MTEKSSHTIKPLRKTKVEKKCFIDSLVQSNHILGFTPAEIYQEVCHDLPLIKCEDGNLYCILHLPGKSKTLVPKFQEVLASRINSNENSFKFVRFPSEIDFHKYEFTNKVSFSHALFEEYAGFSNVSFQSTADFSQVRFNGSVNFGGAIFKETADFEGAVFQSHTMFSKAEFQSEVVFMNSTFKSDTLFINAKFLKEAIFYEAVFESTSYITFKNAQFHDRVNFEFATFSTHVFFGGDLRNAVFIGDKVMLKMDNAIIDTPSKLQFHTVKLRPFWFVNTDPSKFIFVDVNWPPYHFLNNELKDLRNRLLDEIELLINKKSILTSNPNRLLCIALRQLSQNAEENSRYEDASKFRYMAMETKRLEHWFAGRFWTLTWWYRLSSGYGENWGRAAGILLALLIGFGLLFGSPLSRFEKPEKVIKAETEIGIAVIGENKDIYKMSWDEGIVHSLFVAALQRPEPKPYDTQTKFFVIMCTILGPLQAALLLLAIRRKFMR